MKDNIEIRFATEEDRLKVIDLWKYAFSDTDEFLDYYFERRYAPENTVVLLRDKSLEAALQLNPYNLAMGDMISQVSYVVGVSVQPESRGKGFMNKLMKSTLNLQYQRGEDFSILMPIDTRIYTRYGYANCFMRHEFHVDISRLNPAKNNYKIKRLDMNNIHNMDRELHLLSEVYFHAVQENHSFISRNRTYWKNKLAELATDGGEIFLISDDFAPKGYVMLIPKSADQTLNVIEMVGLDQGAFDAISSLIKAHSTQAKKAILVTPQPEEFNLYTQYDNTIEHIIKPFMMGRVINAEKILDRIIHKAKLHTQPDFLGEGGSFCISISDSVIEENNYTVLYKKGIMAGIEKEVCESWLPERRLKMTVSELAQLYLKSTTVKKLHKMGKIEVFEEDLEFFEKIFGKITCQNYINDFI